MARQPARYTKQVVVLVTPEMHDQLAAIAKVNDRSLGAMVRRLLDLALEPVE